MTDWPDAWLIALLRWWERIWLNEHRGVDDPRRRHRDLMRAYYRQTGIWW